MLTLIVKEQRKGMRKNVKTEFQSFMYKKSKKMAKKTNVKASIPRTCGRQTFRNNTNAGTPIARFLPFLDNLLEQVHTCFNGLLKAAL